MQVIVEVEEKQKRGVNFSFKLFTIVLKSILFIIIKLNSSLFFILGILKCLIKQKNLSKLGTKCFEEHKKRKKLRDKNEVQNIKILTILQNSTKQKRSSKSGKS